MSTLVSRVRAITGSTTTQTSNAQVSDFLLAGVKFVYSSIPKELMWPFATDGANINNGSGQAVTSDTILGVRREGLECREIPLADAYAQESAYSGLTIKTLTATFPGYYIRAGTLYIKPDPDASNTGVITRLALPTIDADTEDSWTLAVLDSPIIQYASCFDFKGCASYWRKQAESAIGTQITAIGTALTNFASALPSAISLDTDLPSAVTLTETLPSAIAMTVTLPTFSAQSLTPSYTNMETALAKIQSLIDTDADTYIASDEEDSEMISSIASAAQAEVAASAQELAKERAKIEKYVSDVQQEVQRCANEVNKYRAELEQEVQTFSTEISGYRAELEADVQIAQIELAKYKNESDHATGVYMAELNAAKSYLEEAMARAQELKAAEDYLVSANIAYAESGKCYEMAVSEVERYIKNNSTMIKFQAMTGAKK